MMQSPRPFWNTEKNRRWRAISKSRVETQAATLKVKCQGFQLEMSEPENRRKRKVIELFLVPVMSGKG